MNFITFLGKLTTTLSFSITFGTVILYGALGETLTEKGGNLNLGVPGIMYFGGIAGGILTVSEPSIDLRRCRTEWSESKQRFLSP